MSRPGIREVRVQKIVPEGVQPEAGLTYDESMPIRQCAEAECCNSRDLMKCTRCRTTLYCSKECQRKDWPLHKGQCAHISSGLSSDPEPILQRHLRHWTSRFDISLITAVTVAMKLSQDFSNVSRMAMYIVLRPRPHSNIGSQFTIAICEVVPLPIFEQRSREMQVNMEEYERTMAQHEEQRALLKASSNGERDYAIVGIIAENKGRHKLPGELKPESRFKPVPVYKGMAKSPQLTDPTLDWLGTLKMQVEKDLPTRVAD
ncbi:hypothetical protein JAAARDRAFT_32749 [Jaapia argillacea MUCL 33604]|uniref:MYND-type domain-containing protein n=1 Tax=Jaapia argillacea MUCL 33604 TaxID=933084 RepID=A0A067Q042_9AGAM|nr:hypothetical protein JAAARDRAFT_32749 [Jaapia argillacea MUCL 33604]